MNSRPCTDFGRSQDQTPNRTGALQSPDPFSLSGAEHGRDRRRRRLARPHCTFEKPRPAISDL
jgi:hypothetical protein